MLSTEQKEHRKNNISGQWPRITVVTPNYNYGHFLEETIRSVLLQGYPDLEYMVIDGGSTDNSVEVIKKYSGRLAYWESAPDGGHAHAINKGFSRATGEIMAWINSDDVYLPDTFRAVAEIFVQNEDINWLAGANCVCDTEGRQGKAETGYKNAHDFLSGDYSWIQQESVFWRRSLWEKSGSRMNEEFKLAVDGELWSRFFLFDRLWYVDRVLGMYRSHYHNRSFSYKKDMIDEMSKAILKMRENYGGISSGALFFLKIQGTLKRLMGPLGLRKFYQEHFHVYGNEYHRVLFRDGRWVKDRL